MDLMLREHMEAAVLIACLLGGLGPCGQGAALDTASRHPAMFLLEGERASPVAGACSHIQTVRSLGQAFGREHFYSKEQKTSRLCSDM